MSELEDAKQRLAEYRQAESKILLSQAYQSGGNEMTRTSLAEVRKGIAEIKAEISRLESGRKKGARTISIIPRG